MEQEEIASKMKEENQAIRDEAESDLSAFYSSIKFVSRKHGLKRQYIL